MLLSILCCLFQSIVNIVLRLASLHVGRRSVDRSCRLSLVNFAALFFDLGFFYSAIL
jgi:hypothetical protein